MKIAIQDIADVEPGHESGIRLLVKVQDRISANKQLKDAGIKQKDRKLQTF